MAAITLLRAYQHSFDTRPNLTLSLTGGTLNAVGDAVAQVTQGVVRAVLTLIVVNDCDADICTLFPDAERPKGSKPPEIRRTEKYEVLLLWNGHQCVSTPILYPNI